MAASAQSLIVTAVGLGYDALSDRELKECLLVAAQAGGGGGGSNGLSQGAVDPVAAPTDPASPALYWNSVTGTIFNWNVIAQAWQ